jgi:hypothetical protein
MGDRGYRGLEYVHVCEDKLEKSVRQVIEDVNSQIKLFNGVSRWGNITIMLLVIVFQEVLVVYIISHPRYLV